MDEIKKETSINSTAPQTSGGNPVQKIINSPRQVQEGLAVDLRACNDYKNGLKAAANINCPTLCILGDKDKMVPLDKGKKMAEIGRAHV